jgi:HSP20 family protein
MFEDFFSDDFLSVPVSRQFATPAVNIKESDKDYDIQIAAPGMTKDDFKLSINENNELVIALEKNENKEEKNNKNEKNGTWLRREFSYASYSQSFVIPEDVEVEGISAKMEHGVLNIDLPKKEVVEKAPVTRQITIQ